MARLVKPNSRRALKRDIGFLEHSENVIRVSGKNFCVGEIQVGEPLCLIGHPWGLPTKVSHTAEVLKNDGLTWFMANLDSFEGNSGSAVFNELTGEVEGILVRGKPDAVGQYLPEVGFCKTLNYCHFLINYFNKSQYSYIIKNI